MPKSKFETMLEESGFRNLPCWVKEWMVVATLLCLILFGIAVFLACKSENFWGAVGDLSGWASTIVSALGFVFIHYQLRQHREDSRNAEERHDQTLTQNIDIALLERRLQVYDAVKELLLAGHGNNLDHEKIRKLMLAVAHSRFLFPEDSSLDEYIGAIQKNTLSLNFLAEKQSRHETSPFPHEPLTTQESDSMEKLVQWFSEQYRTGVNSSFLPYLSVTTFSKQPTKSKPCTSKTPP